MSTQFKPFLLVVFALFLIGCGSNATPMPTPTVAQTECVQKEVFCVGFVPATGGIDDKSFHQAIWEGMLQAELELGAKIDFIDTRDMNDYSNNVTLMASKGYDVVITVSFLAGEITTAEAQKHPEINFIGVDLFQGQVLPNVAGLIFPEDQAGYLAGTLAGMMTQSNQVGAVLGPDSVPPIVAFKEGFEAGVKAVNPAVQTNSVYYPGSIDLAFRDPEWGAKTARELLGQGADVIFTAAGSTGIGALQETAKTPGVYCIGVDSDQWYTVEEARPCLVSSAMKLITPGVFELIKLAQEGNFPAGNYYGEVGLAPFHDFEESIPAEVKAKLEEVDAGLKNGSISTGYAP